MAKAAAWKFGDRGFALRSGTQVTKKEKVHFPSQIMCSLISFISVSSCTRDRFAYICTKVAYNTTQSHLQVWLQMIT